LDDKTEKAKKEPTERVKKEAKCPSCGHLWPKGTDICPSCGHVRKSRSLIENVAGELHELGDGRALREDKQTFYSELIYIAQQKNYQSGWASHKYKEKFGVWPRGLAEVPILPSIKTYNWIKHKNIAWAKRQQRGRAA
jgi:hypothetical protein